MEVALSVSNDGDETAHESRNNRDSHRRQTSEPALLAVGERPLFERGWSSNDVASGVPSPATQPSSASSSFAFDVTQLQLSWASPATTATPATALPAAASSTALARPVTGRSTLSSAIHDAARITDWDGVLELCQQHPHWASYTGRDGWTALHHACNRRCPRADVVEALIHACPQALWQEEDKGWLPLHYACRFKAPRDVVHLLLHAVPSRARYTVGKRDRLGRTPLYYALRYDAPAGVVHLLLNQDRSVVLEPDNNDDSPLAIVWDSWAEKLEGKRLVHSFLPGGFPEPEGTTGDQRAAALRLRLQKEAKLKKRWNQANMLLQAAFGFPVPEEPGDTEESTAATTDTSDLTSDVSSVDTQRVWRIVHATAAVKCHLSLFLLACALHPEQVVELDQGDLLGPQRHTVESKSTNSTTTNHQGSASCTVTGKTALHWAAQSNAGGESGKSVILRLLSMYKEAAAVVDSQGCLPLHYMVENSHKKDWIQHAAILHHFYPRAIQTADGQGRLPLHRAAAAIHYSPGPTADPGSHHNLEVDHAENVEEGVGAEHHSIIRQLVRIYPQATSHADHDGYLPFHYACQNAQDWDDDLEAIFQSHRPVVQARTRKGMLPLHLAAASVSSTLSLLQRLVAHHPRAASIPDAQGKLPLHLACAIGKEWPAVQVLLEAYPTAIQIPVNLCYPLHMACRANKDIFSRGSRHQPSLIGHLVRQYPAAAGMADMQGQYPLHLACVHGKRWDGEIELLLEAYPLATVQQDRYRQIPWHCAALRAAHRTANEKTEGPVPSWWDGSLCGGAATAASHYPPTEMEYEELHVLFELLRADPTIL